jgi:Ternary complex associated domain 9
MAFTHEKFVIRRNVLWVGPPEDNAEFTNRQLSVESCDSSAVAGRLPSATAIIVNVREASRGGLAADLRLLAGPALDHGLAVHVIADSDATQHHVAYVLKTLSLTERVVATTKPSLYVIAERIARHDSGPSPNSDLIFHGESLSANAELLLRRAFCDCKRVLLKRLAGGATSDLLSVYAVFRDSLSGPRPLPFFAKIGARSSIEQEQQIYRQYVEHFVPFYLRPSLDYDRCVFGFENAVLVGNFVEYSESLSDVARRNIAQSPIHSLFDHALRGWRLQANELTNNLLSAMPGFVSPDEIPGSRLVEARDYGVVRSPHELETLLKTAPVVSHLSAPYHGDLHADNVRVRGNDAILIDFQRVRTGPLLADHACLEISLAFNEHEGDSNDGWTKLIDTLFSDTNFVHPPGPPLEPAPREWLWNAVRQIRTIALANQRSQTEYLQIVVISLLRFARLPRRPTDTSIAEARKAYAYFIADRLAGLVGTNA